MDFNLLLHELRTIELRRLPIKNGVLLSAGCAGRWYFDWVDEAVGPLQRHIGVELFSQRPESLPRHVEWIAASASAMAEVPSGSVGTVYSGQHLEHLWNDEMVSFFAEASRVLVDGGSLVIDSPNRLATEGMGWVQPEHTIEITAAEAEQLLVLAGFDVTVRRGLWNCRDRDGTSWQTLFPAGNAAAIIDRAAGRFDLDDAFVWWVEATKSDRPFRGAELATEVGRLFDAHWTNRVNRATSLEDDQGTTWLVTQGFPLFEGDYTVTAGGRPMIVRRADGSELARGTSIAERVDATEFGVRVAIELDGGERPVVEVGQQPGRIQH